MSHSCLQMCRMRVGWMCTCLCAHHTRVLFQSIFKGFHGLPPQSSLIVNVFHWIEKISPIFTSPNPPGFCWDHWFNLSSTCTSLVSPCSMEQFWALLLPFRHIVPLFLLILNFSLWDFSCFLVISKRFFLALSIALPTLKFSCTSVSCVLPGKAFCSHRPLVPPWGAHCTWSYPSFPLPSLPPVAVTASPG